MSKFAGNKWTDDEISFILDKFKEGKTIEEIHSMGKISRSKYAIECKIYGNIYDLLQNGKTHKEVAETYKISKKEVKEIEIKAFEMKNKTDTKTVYTNDTGYKYGESSKTNILDLNEFHNLNRTMNTVLSYYENIERLNKLKGSNTIDEQFYTQLMGKLKEFVFDKEKIVESLNVKNISTSNKPSEKEDSDTNSNKSNKSDKVPFINNGYIPYVKKTEDDGVYAKKITKRLI